MGGPRTCRWNVCDQTWCINRAGKRLGKVSGAPGGQGLSRKIPLLQRAVQQVKGSEGTNPCPLLVLAIRDTLRSGHCEGSVIPLTLRLSAFSLSTEIGLAFLFNNIAINTAWLILPKRGDQDSLCNCSGILTMTAGHLPGNQC